ncbi:Uncharacterized protein OBRU01_17791 [Operophtera brumata]|uniref:Uncharacterized protein n=1 Tax=Operophtera brumata TaxID=104452 RepID=A0A0L7KQ13_OPEBR|nr:Uncharacterized protein OBRU01_17791 [Operophtera brumata]
MISLVPGLRPSSGDMPGAAADPAMSAQPGDQQGAAAQSWSGEPVQGQYLDTTLDTTISSHLCLPSRDEDIHNGY